MTSGPDRLNNALVRMRNGQGLRRVVRDDGQNGLWVSPPDSPAQMRPISREEFDAHWEVVKSGDQQQTEDIARTIYGRDTAPERSVVMNIQDATNRVVREETPVSEARKNEGFDGGRSELTDRDAIVREILGDPVVDATFSGEPTAANEEPISTFEEDRGEGTTSEDVEAREAELAEQFETHEAPDPDTLPENIGETEAEAAADTDGDEADEPMAGNEDPTPKKRGRKSAKKDE